MRGSSSDLCRGRPSGGTRHTARRAALGFTLIELLVVISIIGLLAAFLFPVFATAREQARQITCRSNLRQIAQAHRLYVDDWDERLPAWYYPAAPRPEPWGDFQYWTEFFQPYLKSQAILRDPAAKRLWETPEGEKLAEYALATWGHGGRGTRAEPAWQWPGPPLSLAAVGRPAEAVIVTDGWTSVHAGRGEETLDLQRHRGGFHAAFLDGHVAWMTEGEFWRVDQDASGVYYLRYAAANR